METIGPPPTAAAETSPQMRRRARRLRGQDRARTAAVNAAIATGCVLAMSKWLAPVVDRFLSDLNCVIYPWALWAFEFVGFVWQVTNSWFWPTLLLPAVAAVTLAYVPGSHGRSVVSRWLSALILLLMLVYCLGLILPLLGAAISVWSTDV